MLNNW